MLVTRILGDCPKCGGKEQFGNVFIKNNQVLRGCLSCNYRTRVMLPEIRKKILYLDQFFFSSAFREKDDRFVNAAQRIRKISALQLLAVPFSTIHEDETHQWRGYDGKNKEDLMEFVKATSRGHEFEPDYEVERTQIVRAFKAFLSSESDEFDIEQSDAVDGDIHRWDDYFRIDINRYIGEIEFIRDLKRQSIEDFVNIFPSWRQSTNTFEQDVMLENQGAAKSYMDFYLQYATRVASGDYNALFDSPIKSQIVQSLLFCFPDEVLPQERLEVIAEFFKSSYFAKIPYQLLSSRIFATLKDMVKRGAYANKENAIRRLSGFYQDVKHVSTYTPYCDGFIMDQAMASLAADGRVDLEDLYEVKIFSLNNWDDLFTWLDNLETGMSEEHQAGLASAYA